MSRQVSWLLAAIALIAMLRYLPCGVLAADDAQSKTNPPVQGKPPVAIDPKRFQRIDIGEIEDKPPPEPKVDPTLKVPARNGNHADLRASGRGGSTAGELVVGSGTAARSLGSGSGFGGRGSGSRPLLVKTGGGNKESEYAVAGGLVWLANHQLSDGSWSFINYTQRCTDKTCTGLGEVAGCEAGATALGLLPFLAAGQTHKSKGPYKEHVLRAVEWLVRHQTPDGNLAKGAQQMMYSHGLATIALCEAYGLTGDKDVGLHAQQAIHFILKAQNQADGGWRYNPGDPGDTCVTGWQLMALKSGHMAGLDVGGAVYSGTRKWLDAVAVHDGAEYGYQPGQGSSNTMTAVGLLCRQYLGAKRDDPMLTGGTNYLLNHLPDEGFSNIYYWYYATQVLHNMGGDDWAAWNRKMRDLLIRTQVRRTDECANGSWPPERDNWGKHGGRLLQTSLSLLTLEIYYRYLPLYKRDAGGGAEKRISLYDSDRVKPGHHVGHHVLMVVVGLRAPAHQTVEVESGGTATLCSVRRY